MADQHQRHAHRIDLPQQVVRGRVRDHQHTRHGRHVERDGAGVRRIFREGIDHDAVAVLRRDVFDPRNGVALENVVPVVGDDAERGLSGSHHTTPSSRWSACAMAPTATRLVDSVRE